MGTCKRHYFSLEEHPSFTLELQAWSRSEVTCSLLPTPPPADPVPKHSTLPTLINRRLAHPPQISWRGRRAGPAGCLGALKPKPQKRKKKKEKSRRSRFPTSAPCLLSPAAPSTSLAPLHPALEYQEIALRGWVVRRPFLILLLPRGKGLGFPSSGLEARRPPCAQSSLH